MVGTTVVKPWGAESEAGLICGSIRRSNFCQQRRKVLKGVKVTSPSKASHLADCNRAYHGVAPELFTSVDI